MVLSALEDRPPYVIFEVREFEDREASIAAGHYVGRDVDYAVICPQGSRDRIERDAKEWLTQLQLEVSNDRFPDAWYKAYKAAYADWKEGRETPENGVAIKSWPVLSPSQVSHLLNLRIRTVEDLANLNEEGILRIGMGARALQQKARDWLADAKDSGKTVQQLEQLRIENEQLMQRNVQLEEAHQEMSARLTQLEKLMMPAESAAKKL